MSCFVRTKRVTDPLDDSARARLVGSQLSYVSSGSEHSAEDDDWPCLSELIHGFLEDDPLTECSPGYDPDSDLVDPVTDCTDSLEDLVRSMFTIEHKDSYRNLLLAHVLNSVEAFSCFRDKKPVLRRKVVSSLRELGHNAAICKTKWESSGGLTAGNYEFIEVIQSSTSTLQNNRYIVDLEFSSQFEIARPTSQYSKVLQHVPRVFVGKSESLKRIVKAMCDVAKRSLKSRDLSLPPWRKNRYMQNKWFGPYRRTLTSATANSLTAAVISAAPPVNVVKCRCVGFEDAVYGSMFVRTR